MATGTVKWLNADKAPFVHHSARVTPTAGAPESAQERIR